LKILAAALLSSLPALAGCSTPTPPAFYQQPARAQAGPGAVIALEPLSPSIPGAATYRVLYNSEDINGAIIPVSGVIFIPTAPPPPGGRNTVAWAHATTGIAPACAPSLDTGGIGSPSLADSIPGLQDFISAGDIVAATDYQGMGTPGIHPYLIGKSEGQNILDSVRAAEHLPGADPNGNFVVWGHSQGGQAALFAGQLAATYAPELHLRGVAAAAPPTDMQGELTEPFRSSAGRLLAAYVYYSWSVTYHVPITTVVYPQNIQGIQKIATKCINSIPQAVPAIFAARRLNPFWNHPPAETPPWPALFAENSPGHAPPGAPLLILQGTKDPTVEPHWTTSFAATACANHDTIELQYLKGVHHLDAATKSLPIVEPWIAARFAGEKAPDNCGAG
jgi:alpha-beta hydrolase superfamily lysophospholipase